MGKDYTKQHIVPACYLANFGKNGNEGRRSKVYYYIKDRCVSGCGSVEKFPVENGFYDIPELGEKEKALEFFFQKIETQLSDLLKNLLNFVVYEKVDRSGDRVYYEPSMRAELCGQFALLIQRTDMQRKQIQSIYEQLCEGFPFIPVPAYDKEDFKRLHNNQILDLNQANFYANMFENTKWAVLVNHTDLPFWTSDNPIISINHGTQEHISAASDHLTYYIPISPKFSIEMYPKSVNWTTLPILICMMSGSLLITISISKKNAQGWSFQTRNSGFRSINIDCYKIAGQNSSEHSIKTRPNTRLKIVQILDYR